MKSTKKIVSLLLVLSLTAALLNLGKIAAIAVVCAGVAVWMFRRRV